MGQRQSRTTVDKETPTEGKSGDHSGIFLSEELQGKIVQDFNDQLLQQEWKTNQRRILDASNARLSKQEKRKVQLAQQYELWEAENALEQNELDKKIDALKSKFADMEVETMYDASMLEKKIGSDPKYGEGKSCLDDRMDLSNCFKSTNDVRTCDKYLTALEKCVTQTVSTS